MAFQMCDVDRDGSITYTEVLEFAHLIHQMVVSAVAPQHWDKDTPEEVWLPG